VCIPRKRAWTALPAMLGALWLLGCPRPDVPPRQYTYAVIAEYPHDPRAFTQGLVIADGVMYEGTGLHGRTSLRQVRLDTGEVERRVDLSANYFGEGITVFGDRIFQLTWREHTAFVYDRETFALIAAFDYPTEGWGITHDGVRLIMSDGTSTLYFRDPDTFEEIDRVEVRDGGRPVIRLNELEYILGEVYANVWLTDRIARINPETGRVAGWIDLTGLLPLEDRTGSEDVLNGIARDPGGDRLFVTGKFWPKLYEIELIEIDI
jgi:glutamine cyclotransferase